MITGSTGFIGSWLVLEFLEADYDVVVIVRNKEKLIPEIKEDKRVKIIQKDLSLIQFSDFESDRNYKAFIHLAWEGVAPDKKNEIGLQLKNISISLHSIEIAKKLSCERFLASGTVAEYVLCTDVMDFKMRQTPNDLYGAAKVSNHYFLEVRAKQLEQPFNWCVIPSTYGERRIDSNIVTYTITSLLKEQRPLYGELTQMWDFLYVKDVVHAIRLIIEKGKTEVVYGIGSGVYRPLREYIEIIRNVINPNLPIGIGELEYLTTTTFSSCVNNYELVKDTGFQPSISFEEGINKTVEYFKKMLLDKGEM